MAVSTEIETITPTKAKHWLEEYNNDNRNPRKNHVDKLARDMKNGRWKVDGSSICFNGNGTLLNGQHRLMACVQAQKSFRSIVVRGLDKAARVTMDTGVTRGFADILKYMGYNQTNQLASVVRWCVMYENEVTLSRAPRSHQELLDWLSNNRDVFESVRHAHCKDIPFLGIKTAMQALHYYTTQESPEEFEVFYHLVRTGNDLSEGNPVLALRNWLEWNGNLSAGRKAIPIVSQAILIKAWNGWLEGRQTTRLRFSPGGSKPEQFPRILIPEVVVND